MANRAQTGNPGQVPNRLLLRHYCDQQNHKPDLNLERSVGRENRVQVIGLIDVMKKFAFTWLVTVSGKKVLSQIVLIHDRDSKPVREF